MIFTDAEKKMLILYFDRMLIFDDLTDEEIGQLMRALVLYAKDGIITEFDNRLLRLAFGSIKPDIDYAAAKYEAICKKRSESGKKGMAKRWGKESDVITNDNKNNKCYSDITNDNNVKLAITNDNKNNYTIPYNTIQYNTIPNNIDILSSKLDDVSPKKAKKSDKHSAEISEIIEYLNTKTGKHYSPRSGAAKKYINARLDEGYGVEDFKKAIDNKSKQWLGTENEKYLRPSTLFNSEKFEGYANESIEQQTKKKHYYDGEEIQRQLLAQFMDEPEKAI